MNYARRRRGRNDLQPGRQLRSVHGSARARGRRHPHDSARRAHQRVERVEHVDARRAAASTRASRSSRGGRSRSTVTPILNNEFEQRHDVRRSGRLEPEQSARRQHHRDRGRAAAERQPARPRRKAASRSIRARSSSASQGIVRPVDIGPENTVSVDEGRGRRRSRTAGAARSRATNRPGWLTRFFNSPWFPF